MEDSFRLPILTYHSIDESGSIISTNPETFALQIEYWARAGYQSVSLKQAAALLSARDRLPSRTVVLTFDDGFRSVPDTALPILRHHGFTATVFLVTGCLGSVSPWLAGLRRTPPFPLMGPAEVETLVAAGWEIAGHSHTHPRLTGLADGALDRELTGCREALTLLSGGSGFWFAYPYGAYDRRVQERVRRQFEGSCGTTLGFAAPGSNLFALERIDMYYLWNPACYRSIGSRRLAAYLALRRLGRALRSRVRD